MGFLGTDKKLEWLHGNVLKYMNDYSRKDKKGVTNSHVLKILGLSPSLSGIIGS